MKLVFSIEYRTRWGERLVLRMGRRHVELEYTEEGIWRGSVDRIAPGTLCTYHYELHAGDRLVRREWEQHRCTVPDEGTLRELRIRDRWQERDDASPFRATAFTQGIFGRETTARRPHRTAATIVWRVDCPQLRPDEQLAVAGNIPELGLWQRPVAMDDREFPFWSLRCDAREPFEYKFVVLDRKTGAVRFWEEGDNRRWAELPPAGACTVDTASVPRLPERRWRGAGTAVPVFSLRSAESFGIGEFADLKLLVDWAVQTGQRVLQLLPVNDTTMTGTWEDSYPYNANSTFALHPQFIRLTDAGVEEDAAYRRLRDELNALPAVDYERVNDAKHELLRAAFERHGARTAARRDYKEYMAANGDWLIPYAAYCTLRDRFATADCTRWGDYARYDKKKIDGFCRDHAREIAYHCYVQYHLHRQFSEVCRYAHEHGVVLKGDLPIGVSRTSCDAWLAPHLFHLDSQAGAPPDAFSAEGQNWGFPTYDWERMAQDDYAWWRARLKTMSAYFDAFRIDHILGFFRIWEIPADAIHGLLGHFNPALPYTADELRGMGFDLAGGRYTTPPTDDWVLEELFGERADEVRGTCLHEGRLIAPLATQRSVAARFAGDDDHDRALREGLLALLDDVLFVEDPRRRGCYHPRIGARTTRSYRKLDEGQRRAFDRLHDDFFYRRHDLFWQQSAERKLPALLAATGMLACGEDLGMIPACVPDTMARCRILSLEIQRMPKSPSEAFASPARYPYLSVCTTSTHDMNPLRAWWEEDRGLTQRFYNEVLGAQGPAPATCEPWIARRIVEMHLHSPAMFTILPLQDWLATDAALRSPDAAAERINVPAIPRYYWRYRMHLTLEQLLAADAFNDLLHDMIASSGRM